MPKNNQKKNINSKRISVIVLVAALSSILLSVMVLINPNTIMYPHEIGSTFIRVIAAAMFAASILSLLKMYIGYWLSLMSLVALAPFALFSTLWSVIAVYSVSAQPLHIDFFSNVSRMFVTGILVIIALTGFARAIYRNYKFGTK